MSHRDNGRALTRPTWLALFIAACVFVLAITRDDAHGQHNHAQHHDVYRGWVNGAGAGCCNDRDCGELPDIDERTIAGKLEVRIEGQWCPVLPHHYLKKGNAPNWSSAHVCVAVKIPEYGDDRPPCERLLCYQPRPLF